MLFFRLLAAYTYSEICTMYNVLLDIIEEMEEYLNSTKDNMLRPLRSFALSALKYSNLIILPCTVVQYSLNGNVELRSTEYVKMELDKGNTLSVISLKNSDHLFYY